MRQDKNNRRIISLIFILMIILIGGVLFAAGLSGWFDDPKIILSEGYRNTEAGIIDLSIEEYEKLIDEKKSFVVLIDQNGCVTADRMRGYVKQFARDNKILVYKMMFPEVKESTLHEYIKYYPSVAIFGDGRMRGYLRADSDEDAEIYNDYGAFSEWMKQKINF